MSLAASSQQIINGSPQDGEETMRCIVTIPNTKCYHIHNHQKSLLSSGEFQAFVCADDVTVIIFSGGVTISINYAIPTMKVNQYTYVFPNNDGTFTGIVFSDKTPLDDLQVFEGILQQYSKFQIAELTNEVINEGKEEKETGEEDKLATTGHQVAEYIRKGTELAQKGIQQGTIITAKGINKGKEYMKKKIKIREEKNVDPKVKERIAKIKIASQAAVKVSRAVVVGARAACNELANNVADSVSKTSWGQKLKSDEDPKLNAVKDVGKSTVTGLFLLLEELEQAALVLVGELADASADVAEHKYGKNVGEIAQETADIVKDSAHLVKNVTDLGIKPLARQVIGSATLDAFSTSEEEKILNRKLRESDNNIDPAIKTAAFLAVTSINHDQEKK